MKARIKKGNGNDLTKGTLYDVLRMPTDNRKTFLIKDDTEYKIECLETRCAHLGGGSWEFVESNDGE